MLFLGTFNHGDKAVRKRLRKLCERHPTSCQVHHYRLDQGSDPLSYMKNATFCLQPGGDTPARKSLVDAITLGCIPVLFSPMQDEFMPLWSWHRWRDRGRVLVDRSEFLRGKINLIEYLSEIAADPVRIGEMQSTLERHARSMQVMTVIASYMTAYCDRIVSSLHTSRPETTAPRARPRGPAVTRAWPRSPLKSL